MTITELLYYWSTLPIGESGIVATYDDLCSIWHCDKRRVRAILAALSDYDNGDGYILIRSSHSAGFYLTKDRAKIENYRREVYARAMNTLRPLKKIKRVLNRNEQITIDDLLLFGDGIEPLNFDK